MQSLQKQNQIALLNDKDNETIGSLRYCSQANPSTANYERVAMNIIFLETLIFKK
jgi:hypothetical protein